MDLDPKRLWQNQTLETKPLSATEIQCRAQRLFAEARRNYLASLTLLAGCGLFAVWQHTLPLILSQRIGFSVAAVCSIAGLLAIHKYPWFAPLPVADGAKTGLDFYRNLLRRSEDHSRRIWAWLLAPLSLDIASYFLPVFASALDNPGLLRNMAPFLTLLFIWTAALFWKRRARLRELHREIDAVAKLAD